MISEVIFKVISYLLRAKLSSKVSGSFSFTVKGRQAKRTAESITRPQVVKEATNAFSNSYRKIVEIWRNIMIENVFLCESQACFILDNHLHRSAY